MRPAKHLAVGNVRRTLLFAVLEALADFLNRHIGRQFRCHCRFILLLEYIMVRNSFRRLA
jgi:hypothetical protein